MEINQVLEEYGLSTKETQVYLTLLKLGTSKASEIYSKSNLVRETVYKTLENLRKKGLVSKALRKGIQYYSAAPPEKMLRILKDKELKIKEILPELKILEKAQIKRPKIEVFEGKEGVRAVFDDAVSMPNSKIYGIYNGKFSFKVLPFQIYRAIEKKVENNTYSDLIMDDSKPTQDYQKKDHLENRETRILDFMKKVKAGMFIYGTKIAYMTYDQQEPVGIIIDDKHIHNFNKEMFKFMWKTAKK